MALYQQGISNPASDWPTNIVILLGIFLTSAITYNNISK